MRAHLCSNFPSGTDHALALYQGFIIAQRVQSIVNIFHPFPCHDYELGEKARLSCNLESNIKGLDYQSKSGHGLAQHFEYIWRGKYPRVG
jgi:hypothetical protein